MNPYEENRRRLRLLADAQTRWGRIADRHRLVIVAATEDQISVNARDHESTTFIISKLVLHKIIDVNIPFEHAAWKIGLTPGSHADGQSS